MSLKSFSNSRLGPLSASGSVPQVGGEVWVRHPAWLPMPEVSPSEQKFVGLMAVFPTENYVALLAQGNYTVDWGDGVSENFNSNVLAEHQHSYADADLAGTDGPVSFSGAGDSVTRQNHGFLNGYVVAFWNISGTTGITEGASYFVVNASIDTFQIAATRGGSPVALTGDGAGTLLPYKQALVTVTPNGGNLTYLGLDEVMTAGVVGWAFQQPWLDMVISGPNFGAEGFYISRYEPG